MASNKTLVPEAKEALEKFEMEAANEVGVTLSQGYNGDLTSRQAGSIGGQMVNNVCPVRLFSFNLLRYFSVFFPVNILIASFAVSAPSMLTMILSMY